MMSKFKPDSKISTPSTFKATAYGMGWGLLISLLMGYLFEDLALGLVFGLGIGAFLTYERLKPERNNHENQENG